MINKEAFEKIKQRYKKPYYHCDYYGDLHYNKEYTEWLETEINRLEEKIKKYIKKDMLNDK